MIGLMDILEKSWEMIELILLKQLPFYNQKKKSDNPFFEEEKGLDYKFIKDHYHQSYWGRMVSWRGEFNQIENVIKILSSGKASKKM